MSLLLFMYTCQDLVALNECWLDLFHTLRMWLQLYILGLLGVVSDSSND